MWGLSLVCSLGFLLRYEHSGLSLFQFFQFLTSDKLSESSNLFCRGFFNRLFFFLDGFLFSHLQCSLQLHMFVSYEVAFFGAQNAFRSTYNFVLLPWWLFSESKLLKKPFNFSFLSLCFPSVKNIFRFVCFV